MKKYKLGKDEQDVPGDDEIRKYKDFGKLIYNYEKVTKPPKPLYKDPKAFLVLVLIILVTYLLFNVLEEGEETPPPDNKDSVSTPVE